MKYFLLIVFFLVGCGPDIEDKRTPRDRHQHPPHHHHDDGPDKHEHKDVDTSGYVVVGSVTINVDMGAEGLYVGPAAETITYTTANQQNVDLNAASLNNSPTEALNGLSIDLGSIDLSNIKVNKLKVCGAGGVEKCTSAIIRVYTNAITGHAAIEGFVNKDDDYGVPVNITKTGATTAAIGHLVAGAVTLSTYTIPASDNKLTTSDFTGANPTAQLVDFPLTVDFSNGGFGSYEMNITVEIALGPAVI